MIAPDRIYGQYRSKPKAVAWYQITRDLAQSIYETAQELRNSYDIDTNIGAQLDIIGNIVVINRNLLDSIVFDVTECGDVTAECGNEEAQCSPLSVTSGGEALSDEYFRLVLKSKIAKNNSDATIDDINRAVSFILGGARSRVDDNEDMSFVIEILDPITDIERELISTKDIIPKPQGVRLDGFFELDGVVECGDDTKECGDLTAECAGITPI